MKRWIVLVILTTMFSSPVLASQGDRLNLTLDPVGLIVGSLGMGLDVRVHPQWTFGPHVEVWNSREHARGVFTGGYRTHAYGAGVRANWFAEGTYNDGFYVSPSLNYYSVKVKATDAFANESSAVSSGLSARGIAGYGWFWDSFNIMLGGGLTVFLGNSKVQVTDSSGQKEDIPLRRTSMALEFQLGWTF